ncbi:hypothetical protein DFH09DRAFT_1458977 [Mycena vulgaris]|nr:hypothetical protein DFH09DRAFT_1458977 [Mycena vulgaris]
MWHLIESLQALSNPPRRENGRDEKWACSANDGGRARRRRRRRMKERKGVTEYEDLERIRTPVEVLWTYEPLAGKMGFPEYTLFLNKNDEFRGLSWKSNLMQVLGQHITDGEEPILLADPPELHPGSPCDCGGSSRSKAEQSGSRSMMGIRVVEYRMEACSSSGLSSGSIVSDKRRPSPRGLAISFYLASSGGRVTLPSLGSLILSLVGLDSRCTLRRVIRCRNNACGELLGGAIIRFKWTELPAMSNVSKHGRAVKLRLAVSCGRVEVSEDSDSACMEEGQQLGRGDDGGGKESEAKIHRPAI